MQQKAGGTLKIQMHEKQKAKFFGVFFKLLLTLTSLVGVFFLISIALTKAMHQKEFRDNIRQFNRRRLNPATLHIAGNRSRVYASLEHVGRRSGHEYITPVVAKPLGDGFVIPLPYGADTDWCRNVLAAGKCKLHWNGQEYALEKPEVIPPSLALGAFPFSQRVIFVAGGLKQYLWLHTSQEIPEKIAIGV
jgi:hypothetical protein